MDEGMTGLPRQPPLPLGAPRPRITTLRGPLLVGGGVVVLAVLIGGIILYGSREQTRGRRAQPPATTQTPAAPLQARNKFPKTYSPGLGQAEAVATPAPVPATPPVVELPPEAVPLGQQRPPEVAPLPPVAPQTPAPRTPTAVPGAQGTPPPGRRERPAGQGQAAKPDKTEKQVEHWMFGKGEGALGASPFPDEKPAEEGKAKTSPLLKEANWIQPQDVTRVLYRMQVIPALTLGVISSDIPQSEVRLMVVRPVMDRWHTRVLIPQNAVMIGQTGASQPQFGERRITFVIEQLHFPDGVVLDLGKAKLADGSGQAGLTGDVNNHLAQVGIAAVLSAALSIAARAPFGNQQGFSETLPQQYAGQVGQSLGQSGQQVIQQRFGNVRPTITIPEATEVVVTLSDNLNLAKPPEIIR